MSDHLYGVRLSGSGTGGNDFLYLTTDYEDAEEWCEWKETKYKDRALPFEIWLVGLKMNEVNPRA